MGNSSTGLRPGRLFLIYGGIVLLLFVAVPAAVYVASDPERLELDDSVRRSAPGQFARLIDGYTHYEIGGPPDGQAVVLAAGATVPYYIWDPTFAALTGAGFRVLRYDYYGRGFSDRPEIPKRIISIAVDPGNPREIYASLEVGGLLRSLDGGARALINTMEVRDGDRILDLGCGSGVVAFAAAFRAQRVSLVAVDSHARAVECTIQGAQLNSLDNVTVVLNANGQVPGPGTFDLALGNPPYYSDYRIAEVFVQGARRALKPGGKLLIVAKSYAWYETRMPELFDDVKLHEHKQYTVVEGTQRAS